MNEGITVKYFKCPGFEVITAADSEEELRSFFGQELTKDQTREQDCVKVYFDREGFLQVKQYDQRGVEIDRVVRGDFEEAIENYEEDGSEENSSTFDVFEKARFSYEEVIDKDRLRKQLITVTKLSDDSKSDRLRWHFWDSIPDKFQVIYTYYKDKETVHKVVRCDQLQSEAFFKKVSNPKTREVWKYVKKAHSPDECCDERLFSQGYVLTLEKTYDLAGDIDGIERWNFSRDGRCVRREVVQPGILEELVRVYWDISLDQSGKVTEKSCYDWEDSGGKPCYCTKYKYDSKGLLCRKVSIMRKGEEYVEYLRYTEDDLCKEETCYAERQLDLRTNYVHDEKGRLIKEILQYARGDIFVNEFDYDEKGRIAEYACTGELTVGLPKELG